MWTILFDIDGTLITTYGAGMAAIKRAMTELFDIQNVPKVTLHGQTDYGIISELFRPFGLDVDSNIQSFKERYWEHLPETLMTLDGIILPGALELLECLHSREDVALGIITGNTQHSAQIKLQHFGLSHFFNFGGYGDLHADRNDVARDALIAGQECLGDRFNPNQLWMVGDTANDVRCARAINSKVVAVETGGTSPADLIAAKPDVQLGSLENNCAFFENVFGNSL